MQTLLFETRLMGYQPCFTCSPGGGNRYRVRVLIVRIISQIGKRYEDDLLLYSINRPSCTISFFTFAKQYIHTLFERCLLKKT